MGQWGDTPFENDGGLDAAFALLDHLTRIVERLACGPHPRGASVIRDAEQLAANVELLCLVARAVYRPAMFVPIRGMLLPQPEVIVGWRDQFLEWWRKLAKKRLECTSSELEQLALDAASPLLRLAELSRHQIEQAEATHRQVTQEVADARMREQAQSSGRDSVGGTP
jgi:hypothetical protein